MNGTDWMEQAGMIDGLDDEGAEQTMIGQSMITGTPVQEFGHFLNLIENDTAVRRAVGADGVTIGRAAPAEIVIASPEISRRHCRIEIRGDYAVLTDLGSTNGTHVGGVRLARPMRLRSGTQFSLGSSVIRYERRDHRELAAEDEMAADLRRAEDYVRAILPQPLTTGPVRASWCFVPAAKLGGDAFGYQFLSDTVFTGFLLDVSGHGVGSALHAANVANTLRRRALPGVDFEDPAAVAAGVNDMFPMEDHNGLMLTLWYFACDLKTRQLRFCTAGHHPAFIMTPASPAPVPLSQRGPAIGMLPSANWTTGTAAIPSGTRLMLFSDGAFEIVAGDGRQWGMEDLRQLAMLPSSAGPDAPQQLYRAVRAAARPGPLDDDFSVLLITFT